MQHPALAFQERDSYIFDAFEVLVRPGILRREGERLKIQELPFQMLLMLLEHEGEIVTKKELGERLWGEGTFIEVDESLYVMASKLRKALGDNATQPRFIKTVSGEGYRFIGEVNPVLCPFNESTLEPSTSELRVEITEPINRHELRRILIWGLWAVVGVAAVIGILAMARWV